MSNEDLSRFRDYYEQNKYLTIKAAIVFAAVLMFLLILVPGMSELVGDWQEIKRLQEKVQEAQSWQEVTGRLLKKNRAMEAKLAAVYKEGPGEEVLSGIIKLIQEKGSQAGVRFSSLRPRLPENLGVYQEVSIEMTLRGKYHELSEFVYLLESVAYITQVRHLALSTPDMTSSEISSDLKISFLMAVTREATATETEANFGARNP